MPHKTTAIKDLFAWLSAVPDRLFPIFLVGGSVRDYILGRPLSDFDLICHDAGELAKFLAETGPAALVRFDKKPGEICYRVIERGQNENSLDIVDIRGGNITNDLHRRDFTINAMAMDLHRTGRLGDVVDPFNGRSDLKAGIIRMVSPEAFSDDPLRILRAWRFAAELGFRIDDLTKDQMAVHAPKLRTVAGERILHELLIMLSADNVSGFVGEMADLGVLDTLFQERSGFQTGATRAAGWDESLMVLESCETVLGRLTGHFQAAGPQIHDFLACDNRLPLLKLAALFYFIGVGGKDTVEANAEQIARRLKLSNRDRGFLQQVLTGLFLAQDLEPRPAGRSRLIGFYRDLGDTGTAAIILGLAVEGADGVRLADGLEPRQSSRILSQAAIDYYAEIKTKLAQADFIKGADLIAIGILPGPNLGATLRRVRCAQDEGIVKNRREALNLARNLNNMLNREPG